LAYQGIPEGIGCRQLLEKHLQVEIEFDFSPACMPTCESRGWMSGGDISAEAGGRIDYHLPAASRPTNHYTGSRDRPAQRNSIVYEPCTTD
jgi:hypothetical protein